jgi:L-methionine (R)-S-oxide reductase
MATDAKGGGSTVNSGQSTVNRIPSVQTAKPEASGDLYKDLAASLASLLEGEPDALANLSNASALLAQTLDRINWCGFYLLRGEDLVLGPFQGKPACVRIPTGKGVCGTAAARRETVVVPDVEKFAGHIACDAASRSEIVVPIVEGGMLRGVLDVDAPVLGRFDERDREGLERFVKTLIPLVNWRNV